MAKNGTFWPFFGSPSKNALFVTLSLHFDKIEFCWLAHVAKVPKMGVSKGTHFGPFWSLFAQTPKILDSGQYPKSYGITIENGKVKKWV